MNLNKKMYRYTLIIAICILAGDNIALSQKPTLEWAASYNNTYSASRSFSVDQLGNIFISGYHISSIRSKFITLKYNTLGVFQWVSFYQGPDTMATGGTDEALKNIADGSGNLYVGGRSRNNLDGDDIFLIKYDTKGDSIWSARYNGPNGGDDMFAAMVTDKYANIYVTGRTTPADFVTLKYDSSGTMIWETFYNNNLNSPDYPRAIAIDSSGNVYVTGYSTHSSSYYKYTTVKYNSQGVQQWVKEFITGSDAIATSIAVDRESNIYVSGYYKYFFPENGSYYTIKYDSTGTEIWTGEYGSLYNADIPDKILVNELNDPVIVGSAVVKYNSNGLFQWADTLSIGTFAALDNQNNLYVLGSFWDSVQLNFKLKTIKYNETGSRSWTLVHGNSIQNSGQEPAGIFVDKNFDLYITGNSYVVQQTMDSILLLKYSQPIGIVSNNNEVPNRFELYQNYPNPFNPVTKIKFDIPSDSRQPDMKIKLIIYDLLGKQIASLIDEQLKPGNYEVKWNASNFASGVYFYSLSSVNFSTTKKMLLIK